MADGSSTPRRRFLAAAGAAISATVAGCNDDGGDGTTATTARTTRTTTEPPAMSGAVLELVTGFVGTLDPVAAVARPSEAVVENLFDGLTTFPDGSPEPEPRLAEDVSPSADGTTYTVALKDARFHDGSPVTAADVVYSFERVVAADRSRWSSLLLDTLGVVHETTTGEDGRRRYVPGTLGVSAVNDSTVEIRLAEPFHPTPAVLAYPQLSIVPEGIVGDVPGYDGDVDYETFAVDPVGCGPFELVDWTRRDRVTCRRFDDWHGDDVPLDGVRWEVVGDPVEAHEYARRGNADLVPVPDGVYSRANVGVERTDDVGRAFGTYGPVSTGEDDGGESGGDLTLEYLSVPLVDTFYLGFDMSTVPKPVRRAVAAVTDQHALVREVLVGRGYPAYHLTPPAIYPGTGYEAHARNDYPHGYERSLTTQARNTMETAGYGSNDRYSLTVTLYQSAALEGVLDVLSDRLGTAYVELDVESVPFDALLERGRAGDLEAYGFRQVPEFPVPDAFVSLLFPSRTDTDGANPASFLDWDRAADAGMADARDRARTAASNVRDNATPGDLARQAREEGYVALEEANWEDVGILPLFHRTEERFARDGVTLEPFGGMGSHRQAFDDVGL
jgi:peptide/nickel transport system substrate-binding protein